jgi:hypothetical protein
MPEPRPSPFFYNPDPGVEKGEQSTPQIESTRRVQNDDTSGTSKCVLHDTYLSVLTHQYYMGYNTASIYGTNLKTTDLDKCILTDLLLILTLLLMILGYNAVLQMLCCKVL